MTIQWSPFSAKQLDAIGNSDARINAYDGPVRSGKTVSANVAWTDFIPQAPYHRLLMTGVTRDTLYRNVLADLFDIWGKGNYHYNESKGIIETFSKELHVVGINDRKAIKKVQGATFGGWYADEIVNYPFDVVKMAMTRLSVAGARAFWTMNPDSPYHPIYKEYLTKRQLLKPQNGRPPILKRFRFRLSDNLSLAPEYVESLKALFTGLFYRRMILGEWCLAEGVIYDNFDPAVHVINRDEFERRFGVRHPPDDWVKVRCIDFGYNHPFVCQWWAISPDGEWYLYREIYWTKRLVEDHARDIVRLSAGEQYAATWADHDAEDRATLEKYGIPTNAANKAVTPGIQLVHQMLNPDPVTHRPKLYVLSDALVARDPKLEAAGLPTCTEEEFGTYSWMPPEKSGGEDKPVKEADHGMDPTRYGVYSMATIGAAKPVAEVSTVKRQDVLKGAAGGQTVDPALLKLMTGR